MIDRLALAGATAVPIAAVVAPGVTVATSQPVVWHALGYPFEAASMVAAIGACVMVRFWVAVKDLQHYRLTLDAPVSALTIIFTAALVLKMRPEPLFAILYGIGIGVTGAGLIAIGKSYVDKYLPPLAGSKPNPNERTDT